MATKKKQGMQVPIATEESLTVPVEWINKGQGLALDIGCDTTRVLFQPKSQLQQWKLKFEGASHGKVRMFSFPTSNLDRVIDYILSNASVERKAEGEAGEDDLRTVYITGIQGAEHKDKLARELDVQIELVDELMSSVAGFCTLVNHYPEKDVVHIPSREDVDAARALVNALRGEPVAVNSQDPGKDEADTPEVPNGPSSPPTTPTTPTTLKPPGPAYTQTDPGVFPCVLAILGNSTRYLKLQFDGSYEEIQSSHTIGSGYAAGLGSLLLRTKTFGELVKLAAQGDASRLHLMGRDLNADDTRSTAVPDDLACQPFAKASGPDPGKFKREDIAAALVSDFCSRLSGTIQSATQRDGATRVYFCGDVASHELVRRHLTRWLTYDSAVKEKPFEFFFLRETSYLDVIGAFTYHLMDKEGAFDITN